MMLLHNYTHGDSEIVAMTVEISTVQGVQDLLALLKAESEIVLTEANVPVAQLLAVKDQPIKSERQPNLHSRIWIRDDFDSLLPREFWADKL